MIKKLRFIILVSLVCLSVSGCALINAAIGAGIAYGIYQATKN